MVFQTYALYPHMTVRDNLGYGLKVRRTPKAEIKRRVDEVAGLLGLTELLERRPAALSGGQRQRVAMGRAIVREPQAFLMDEPLSNLDAKLRVGMRASLAQLHERLGVTTVYVTHDQIEAMTLGQRVAVMRNGHLLQVDAPQRLYHEPRNLFVAAFIGSPAMNLVEATIDGDSVVFGQFRVPLAEERRPDLRSGRVVLGIRPESFEDAALAQPGKPTLEADLRVVEELGSDVLVLFPVDAPSITAESLEASAEANLLLEDAESLFTARLDPLTSGRPGGRLTLAVDPARFHFFDPSTGDSLLDGCRTRARAGSGARRAMTKTRETRERVLDLIERLNVGEAIPSERQLSADLGVSRLTVRAALDDLVREGHLVRRRGAGTFVSEPKIAQELTMTSFTDDMRQRGLNPGSRTLELTNTTAGARLGRLLARLAFRARRRREAATPRRPRDDGDRGAARPRVARARPLRGRPRQRLLLQAAPGPVRDRRRRRRPDRRADGDERGGVGAARRAALLAGVPLRADHALVVAARSSSTCARSTAATAIGWSPSSAQPARMGGASPTLRPTSESGLDNWHLNMSGSPRGQVV